MYNHKLCLGLFNEPQRDIKDQIKCIANTGFEEIFFGDLKDLSLANPLIKFAKECGLAIQSYHAPFGMCQDLWIPDCEDAEEGLCKLLKSAELCSEHEIPIMVSHTFIGFYTGLAPTSIGIERYGKVIDRCKELGVKIAFENTEGEEFLSALMNAFKSESHVGFCLDTGHEQCYNYGKDLLSCYGDKLISTHINDNLGIKDFNGKITFYDDLHLLPFDGIIDWKLFGDRIKKCGYNGTLTFELKKYSNTTRTENNKYSALTMEEYITECYIRACKVASMI